MNNPLLIGAVALTVVLASAWFAVILRERHRASWEARLEEVAAAGEASENDDNVSLRRSAPGNTRPILRMLPTAVANWVMAELAATGGRLTLLQLVIAALVALVATILSLRFFQFPPVILAPLALIVSIAGPLFLLRRAQRRFQSRFEEGFVDALDIIVRAVRAGLPVLDAVHSATAEAREPVAGEFRHILNELRIGLDLEDVLNQASGRIRVTDFRFFAVSLVLQRRTGGALAETLSNLSRLIRQRGEVRIKARALTSEARASAMVLGLLPVVIMAALYLITPQTIGLLFSDSRGNVILGIAVISLCTGITIMKTMIKRALR